MSHREIEDPEVLAFIRRVESLGPADPDAGSIHDRRRAYDRMAATLRHPRPPGVAVEQDVVRGPERLILLRRYWPVEPGPARVVWFHGGGFALGGLESHDDICAEVAVAARAEVVAVDYRLAPEDPHPAASEDAVAAVAELADRPVVVAGDSAGGTLAAVAAMSRHPAIVGQVLVYPGLGGEVLGLPSYTQRAEAPLLSTRDVLAYQRMRAVGEPPMDDPTFAPLAAADVAGLAPCFVSAAEHDPLQGDARAWGQRLSEAGVAVEVVVEPELPHGHLRARHVSTRASAAFARICAAIERFVHG